MSRIIDGTWTMAQAVEDMAFMVTYESRRKPVVAPDTNSPVHIAAACANVADPDMFFSKKEDDQMMALKICATCLIKDECLQMARAAGVRDGIWGGEILR